MGDVAFKLDLQKASDNVNYDLLKECLVDFGFLPSKIKLIIQYVTSSSFSIL
jgi:hypothetical protein